MERNSEEWKEIEKNGKKHNRMERNKKEWKKQEIIERTGKEVIETGQNGKNREE